MRAKSNFLISEETLIYITSSIKLMSDPRLCAHTVPRCVRSSRCETAAPAGDQRQDWSQGRAPVPPTALRRQPATVTPGDGDRTSAFPGKWPPGFPHCTLPQRYWVPSIKECCVSAKHVTSKHKKLVGRDTFAVTFQSLNRFSLTEQFRNS